MSVNSLLCRMKALGSFRLVWDPKKGFLNIYLKGIKNIFFFISITYICSWSFKFGIGIKNIENLIAVCSSQNYIYIWTYLIYTVVWDKDSHYAYYLLRPITLLFRELPLGWYYIIYYHHFVYFLSTGLHNLLLFFFLPPSLIPFFFKFSKTPSPSLSFSLFILCHSRVFIESFLFFKYLCYGSFPSSLLLLIIFFFIFSLFSSSIWFHCSWCFS